MVLDHQHRPEDNWMQLRIAKPASPAFSPGPAPRVRPPVFVELDWPAVIRAGLSAFQFDATRSIAAFTSPSRRRPHRPACPAAEASFAEIGHGPRQRFVAAAVRTEA
jgi:hypothetical protein